MIILVLYAAVHYVSIVSDIAIFVLQEGR